MFESSKKVIWNVFKFKNSIDAEIFWFLERSLNCLTT